MKNLGNKIVKIVSVDSEKFKIKLKFKDGTIGDVSLMDIFEHPKGLAAEVIKGQLFKKCFVESGGLAWSNGLELCPDSLRMKLVIKKAQKAA